MKSKFTSLRPILWTENMDETIGFYQQCLGFTLNERNDDWQWASLEKDEVQIMLTKPNSHEKFNGIGFTGSFYFNVDNVDELWEDLKTKVKSATKSKLSTGQ
ncbi:VOC family protein [Chryseobacterium arachidis]|uniref:VOC family protein n=1 Tax=Chryseobacterium arachidis TaxID=1416778 RepID=UPI00361AEE22